MNMMAYHRSDDITIDLMAATIDMMTGLPISLHTDVRKNELTLFQFQNIDACAESQMPLKVQVNIFEGLKF